MATLTTYELAIAGLLHRVGTLFRHAYGNAQPADYREPGLTYQDFTAHFIKRVPGLGQELAEVAKRHRLSDGLPSHLRPRDEHPPDWIVYYANKYASRGGALSGANQQTLEYAPLESIFSQVRLNGSPAPKRVYSPPPGDRLGFAPSLAYPVDPKDADISPETYRRQLDRLIARSSKLPNDADHKTLLANLNMFLLESTWALPADTHGESGISLYDHLRLTAAFAAALLAYHQESGLDTASIQDESAKKFLLIGGDLSGIQRHIYRITESQGSGGIAKRLRARSLEVSLAAEAMALGLLERLDMPPLQRIMSAGGKFYLLLPNTEVAQETLRAHREEWEEWALEQGASLIPVLGSVSFSPQELLEGGFTSTLTSLAVEMARAKLSPLSNLYGRFHDPYPDREGQSLKPCAVCGVRPAARDEPGATCPECERDRQVGTRLPQTRSLSATAEPEKPFYRFPRLSFDLGEHGYVLRGAANFDPAPYPWELRPLLGHLPTVADALAASGMDLEGYRQFVAGEGLDAASDKQPLTFGELALLSEGVPYLGALLLDADRMGEVFIKGLASQRESSPARIAALSRAVDTFFTLEVGGLIEGAERYRQHLGYSEAKAKDKARRYRLIYTVYSGGDDLFLIGPWDVVLEFAADLNQLYQRYTGSHPSLTISGGFAIMRPTTPVPQIYESAHRAEQSAKEKGKDPKSPTRGQGHLGLFGQAVPWSSLNGVQGWAQWLKNELQSGRFPSALAYRLLKLHQRFTVERDPARKMAYKPQLAYTLRNYVDDSKYPGYFDRLGRLLDHTQPEWAHLPVWVEWGLYGARGRNV